MAGFDWKATLGAVAPVIATALGGPMAGVAVRAVSSVLLGTEEGSEEQIAAAVATATPDKLLALKKADADFKARMAELEVDLERIAAGDRDSARQREVQVKDKAPIVLAICAIGGLFSVLAGLLSGVAIMPREYEAMVMLLVGALGRDVGQVFNYYFGSSAGSAAKDKTIHNAINGGAA